MPSNKEAITQLLEQAKALQETNSKVESNISNALVAVRGMDLGFKDVSHESMKSETTLTQPGSGSGSLQRTESRKPSIMSMAADDPFTLTDPFERRRRIIVHNAQQLEKDALQMLNQLLSGLYENEAITSARKAVTRKLNAAVKRIEANDRAWFADEINAAAAIGDMTQIWSEALARAHAIKDACGMSFEDLQWKIQDCDKRLRDLKDCSRANAAIALWEAEDMLLVMDLDSEGTEKQLEEFLSQNKVELEHFTAAEEDLFKQMDQAYGETKRMWQESLLFFKQAVAAIKSNENYNPKALAGLSDAKSRELSQMWYNNAQVPLKEVTDRAKSRVIRHRAKQALIQDLHKYLKIAGIDADDDNVHGASKLAHMVMAQSVQLDELKGILRIMTGAK